MEGLSATGLMSVMVHSDVMAAGTKNTGDADLSKSHRV